MKVCAHKDPGERSSDPTKIEPDLPMSVLESLVEAWVDSAGCGVRVTGSSSPERHSVLEQVLLENVSIAPTTMASAKVQGGKTSSLISRKLD